MCTHQRGQLVALEGLELGPGGALEPAQAAQEGQGRPPPDPALPGGEQQVAHAVAPTANGAADVAPPTTIPDLVGLAHGAQLMISGDTGPLHIAAAVGTPIVALFGPTSAERNGPWAMYDVVVSRTAQCQCLQKRTCRKAEPCLASISVDEVMEAVTRRMGLH